jgi:hypothetical protein
VIAAAADLKIASAANPAVVKIDIPKTTPSI